MISEYPFRLGVFIATIVALIAIVIKTIVLAVRYPRYLPPISCSGTRAGIPYGQYPSTAISLAKKLQVWPAAL